MELATDIVELKGLDGFIEHICKNKNLASGVTGKYDLLLNSILSNENLKQAVIAALSRIHNTIPTL